MKTKQLISQIKNKSLPFITYHYLNYLEFQHPYLSVVILVNNHQQVLNCLKSIQIYSDRNIEVILVDDSKDSLLPELQSFNFTIQYIHIDPSKKTWVNPYINYNIGFNQVQGNITLIQHGNVCYFGNILATAIQYTTHDTYLYFDVCCPLSLKENEDLFNKSCPDDPKNSSINVKWYQSKRNSNHNSIFLMAMDSVHIKTLNGFDYDYLNTNDYSNEEFIFRLENVLKLNVQHISFETHSVFGIYQFEHKKPETNSLSNKEIHKRKLDYFQRYSEWIYFHSIDLVTITGIRPDFIRMKKVFEKLDQNFNHILVHTGQHYDNNLSNVFFQELNIRNPDFILNTGKNTSNHYEQLSYLSTNIIKLFETNNIHPKLVIFLGDSNSVLSSIVLKKQGYNICHIEAGMRSYDNRMFEEINRKLCDSCSDLLFVYHENYKINLIRENITRNIYTVGNTIVELCNEYKTKLIKVPKTNDFILMDIHRPENFNDKARLASIISFANEASTYYNIPVFLIGFKRTLNKIQEYKISLNNISTIDLLPFKEYLKLTYNCKFLISDSGTAQEEPCLLNTKVIVPRDFTERLESYENNCSFKYDLTNSKQVFEWIDNPIEIKTDWLGIGNTSELIIDGIFEYFTNSKRNVLKDFKFIFINLKRSVQRCHDMFQHFLKYDIPLVRFEGVDGSTIEKSEYFHDHSILHHDMYSILYDKTIRLNKKEMTRGQLGASWSHFQLYKILLTENETIKGYFIFEDDARFIHPTSEKLLEYLDNIPSNVEWIQFSSQSIHRPIRLAAPINSYYSKIHHDYFNCAASYFVTKKELKNYYNMVIINLEYHLMI